ncbi:MAG: alcohol dehydrogenase [Planctomycetota bacterium]|nr:MAG: alcohol dehydrogenase [Planctomycetota bacterium]
MRAVRIQEHGGYEVLRLEDAPVPEPGPGQVRIRVAWSALNHLDKWVRAGVPGHKFPLPLTPGCDFSGVVDACGPGVDVQAGTRVTVAPGFSCGTCRMCAGGRQQLCRHFGIYGETGDGGDADYAVVKLENLIPVPDGFPLDCAAAFPLTYLTAWHMLVERCGVRPGDLVLVHAAGSGVSVAAVQIAKLWGARVMITAGSDEKVQKGLDNGAESGVNYRREDWTAAAKAWTGKKGLDIIVDHVGADTLPKGVWALARGGRIVTCGVTSGGEMTLHIAPVFFKSLSVLGSTMGSLGEQKEVAEHVFSGRLRPVIDSRFPLERVADAHRKLDAREAFGKVLLQVDPGLD